MFQISRTTQKTSVASVIHLFTDYRFLMTSLALALSGCMGIYEGGFECPPGHGVGCKSISEVNQMVNQGDLPEKTVSDLSPSQTPCEQCGATRDQPIDPQHPGKPEIWYPAWILEEV